MLCDKTPQAQMQPGLRQRSDTKRPMHGVEETFICFADLAPRRRSTGSLHAKQRHWSGLI
jgi:hypothetical protein